LVFLRYHSSRSAPLSRFLSAACATMLELAQEYEGGMRMPHKIGQARIAVLREAEEDSGVVARNLAGTTGVLEVWESDHKFP